MNQLLKELRPHVLTLVDAFAIPADWKKARILEEEDARQEAMAVRDAELRGADPRCDRHRPAGATGPVTTAAVIIGRWLPDTQTGGTICR